MISALSAATGARRRLEGTQMESSRRRLEFRELERGDFPLLAGWLGAPHAAAAEWGTVPASPAGVEAEFGAGVDGRDPTEAFLVCEGGRPIGLIQCCALGEERRYMRDLSMIDPHPAAAGIDCLIGEPDRVGRGVGTEMIRQFTAGLWERRPAAPSVMAAVLADNPASWRALEKAGFTRIWSGLALSDYQTQEPTYITACSAPPALRGLSV